MLARLIEAARCPKGRKIIWNDAIEDSFKELKRMVSDETLLSYPDWNITFVVHTNYSDKQLGYVISQNNKPITLFSIILSKPQSHYIATKK